MNIHEESDEKTRKNTNQRENVSWKKKLKKY